MYDCKQDNKVDDCMNKEIKSWWSNIEKKSVGFYDRIGKNMKLYIARIQTQFITGYKFFLICNLKLIHNFWFTDVCFI